MIDTVPKVGGSAATAKKGLASDKPWRKTKFGQWADDFGVGKLVHELQDRGHGVTESAVYYWLRGNTVPRHDKARDIAVLSCGVLTLDDVYAHAVEMRPAKQ